MATDSQDNPETVWKVDQRHVSLWRSWNGEVVVYDDLSGDTLKLDVVMAEVFRFLLETPASQSQLADHLASVLEMAPDARLQLLTNAALRRYRHAGLIEPAADDVPPLSQD